MLVIKNDGTTEQFDKAKITKAVLAAFVSSDLGDRYRERRANEIATDITISFMDQAEISIDEIHSRVERALLSASEIDAARIYIEHRAKESAAKGRNIPVEVRQAFDDGKE